MPSSKKRSTPAKPHRRSGASHQRAGKTAARRKRPAKEPAFLLSTVAAAELAAFAKLLRSCKRGVGSFTDDQKHKLRLILSRAHRALEQL